MSIRRTGTTPKVQSPTAPATPAAPSGPASTIHPAAQDAWKKIIQHPSSALLTHVPRPAFGASTVHCNSLLNSTNEVTVRKDVSNL